MRSSSCERKLIYADELVKFYRSMVETQKLANSALSQSVISSNDQLIQLQTDFAHARQTFREQLERDLEKSSITAQSFFEKTLKALESVVQSTLSKVSAKAKNAEADVTSLSQVSRSCAPSRRVQRRMTCYRKYQKPMPILPTWRRMSEGSFSKSCKEAQNSPQPKRIIGKSAMLSPTNYRQHCNIRRS